MAPRPRIGITMGDPAGIGPEIVLKALKTLAPRIAAGTVAPVVVGTPSCLEDAAAAVGLEVCLAETTSPVSWPDVAVVPSARTRDGIDPGCATPETGRLAYEAIATAVGLCQAGDLDAMVTAPISKEALNAAGHGYLGHTDLLADLTGAPDSCMMLALDGLHVTHVSTHVPVAEVPKRVTRHRVGRVIELTLAAMRTLGIDRPRVAVCGLNPHAGEAGLLGDEDGRILVPAIAAFRARGEAVSGPHPGDTVFVKAVAGQFDAVVAMFHDQGHIPVKLLGFAIDRESGAWTGLRGVNVTLGLPITRTSVDHGTAFDIAGKGIANAQSLCDAVAFAERLVAGRPGAASRSQGGTAL